MTLGQRIIQLRKAADLSQAQLAKKLGISQPALANYERDARDPPAAVLQGLCAACKANPMWLLVGIGNMHLQDMGEHFAKSVATAWAYLSENPEGVDPSKLVKLSNALFQYYMEHGTMSEPFKASLLEAVA